ncbi:MAG: hypothetical protein JWN72_777 [Thermoleophilia bacterium]|nr:hypothetical protein [Thermoleophilia bacterium]
MHDGWEYVLATYLLVAVTLGVWFAMILTKLRRARTVTKVRVTGTQDVSGVAQERPHD